MIFRKKKKKKEKEERKGGKPRKGKEGETTKMRCRTAMRRRKSISILRSCLLLRIFCACLWGCCFCAFTFLDSRPLPLPHSHAHTNNQTYHLSSKRTQLFLTLCPSFHSCIGQCSACIDCMLSFIFLTLTITCHSYTHIHTSIHTRVKRRGYHTHTS